MNLGEAPMILFTVITQMCVGMFIVLGVVQTIGSTRYSAKAIDRLADPALFAIGPAMVLGLVASMFHMHDVLNVFNVFRHVGSSWLSREIVFGILFAALGFGFCVMQVLKLGQVRLRQAVAVLTALAGIGLIICQVQIYFSLTTVPAWNSWATWVQFFGTALLLGSLAVGASFVLIIWRRDRRIAQMSDSEIAALDAERERAGLGQQVKDFFADRYLVDSATRDEVDGLLTVTVRAIVAVAIVAAGVLLIAMPIYVSGLAANSAVGLAAAAHYATGTAVVRFSLLVIGALVLGLAAFFFAGSVPRQLGLVSFILVSAFVLVLVGEFVGRYLFYEVRIPVGI